jgi:hypothetical protein
MTLRHGFFLKKCKCNSNIQISNKSFETVEDIKYLRRTLTNQNFIHDKIKSKLKSGNACYHSERNLLSSSLLLRNVKTDIQNYNVAGCFIWL